MIDHMVTSVLKRLTVVSDLRRTNQAAAPLSSTELFSIVQLIVHELVKS